MAFLLRQISHSAEGREIIRPSRIDAERLTIGRDPASDIHLTDLAVALQHATIERTSPQRLLVTAGERLSFELNGRSCARGEIDTPSGGDIRIASHLLRVMPTPAGSDEIAIDIERVTEGEPKLSQADVRRFSLSSVMLGKRAAAWLLAVLVLGLFLAWPVKSYYDRQHEAANWHKFHADEMWTAGKLSQAHSDLEHNCTACHAKPFESVRDQACTACHTSIHDHADPFRLARARPDLSRWGRVQLAFKQAFNLPPGRCVDCHTEHEGHQQMPVTAQRFCSDCHATLKEKLPDTTLEDAGDFGKSHPEFRPALITGWNGMKPIVQRVSMAIHPHEQSGLKFPHAMHLSKSNGVAQMAGRLGAQYGFAGALTCSNCHNATADGTRFQPVRMEEKCQMCHSLAFDRHEGVVRTLRHGDPQQVVAELRDYYRSHPVAAPVSISPMARRRPGEFMAIQAQAQFARGAAAPGQAERAIRGVFSPGGACYDCHAVVAPPGGSLDYKVRPVAFTMRYLNHGWFNHRDHQTASCSSCHAAERSNASSDLLIPDLNSCRACHGGEGSSKAVASSCAMCHDYHMGPGAPTMTVRQEVRAQRRQAAGGRAAGR